MSAGLRTAWRHGASVLLLVLGAWLWRSQACVPVAVGVHPIVRQRGPGVQQLQFPMPVEQLTASTNGCLLAPADGKWWLGPDVVHAAGSDGPLLACTFHG